MLFKKKNEDFAKQVKINNLPILILDETYNLTFKSNKTEKMSEIEEELRELLKEQGGLNFEYNKLLKTKKIRLSKILELSSEVSDKNSSNAVKKMETNQELVEHINDKLNDLDEKRKKLPEIIEKKNYELFNEAVKISYNNISKLSLKIKKLEPEVDNLKEKLKNKMDELNSLNSEYKEKSLFLRTFIGHEGIQILDDEYGGNMK